VILAAGLNVNVLLTDVDMPFGGSGFELAQKVDKSWPEIEILIMSGRQWPEQGDLPPGAAFLAKPCPNESIVSHVLSAAARIKGSYRPKAVQSPSGAGKIVPFPRTA
jgi:DNA-binding NarL/FixJ family response regulator